MSLKVVFFGTPEFAVIALEAITRSNHKIVGVVTNVDKPAGRGKKINEAPVKKYALEKQLPLLQPISLKDPFFVNQLEELSADVFVVVAFRMLPKVVWKIPQKGTFNLHASLLPHYRGAAPINWAIINGEKSSGVSTFLIDEKIDTGTLLLQEKVKIEDRENVGGLYLKLADKGKHLIIKTLDQLEIGMTTYPQLTDGTEKSAPKLNKENTRINWMHSLPEIDALIRGLSPYPGAWTEVHGNKGVFVMKIFAADFEETTHHYPPLKLVVEGKLLKIAHIDGFLICKEVQIPNKKRLKVADLLNGYDFGIETTVK